MSERPLTERSNPRTRGLDRLSAAEVVALMDGEEARTLEAVADAAEPIAAAAEQLGACIDAGGSVVFIGAGTSGRIALAEAAELRPTFGVTEGQFTAWIAGGSGPAAIAGSEDDEQAVARKLTEAAIGTGDAVVGLAASGTTPFVVAGLRAARGLGAWTCGIANNAVTPVLEIGDLGILLDTGPEILTGSTRLQAATAQKLALNRITTAAMVGAGRVIGNQMVDMRVTIAKLERRAVRILEDLGGVPEAEATALLEQHRWNVRKALAEASERDGAGPGRQPAGAAQTAAAGLREGTPGDAAAIRALAIAELGRAPSGDRLAEIIRRYPSVVAAGNGNLRGFAFGVPLAPDIIDLANLLVAETHRGRGLGTRLIVAFEERARGRYGAFVVSNSELWPVPEDRKRSAVPLYLRLGYRVLHRTAKTTLLHKELDPGTGAGPES